MPMRDWLLVPLVAVVGCGETSFSSRGDAGPNTGGTNAGGETASGGNGGNGGVGPGPCEQRASKTPTCVDVPFTFPTTEVVTGVLDPRK